MVGPAWSSPGPRGNALRTLLEHVCSQQDSHNQPEKPTTKHYGQISPIRILGTCVLFCFLIIQAPTYSLGSASCLTQRKIFSIWLFKTKKSGWVMTLLCRLSHQKCKQVQVPVLSAPLLIRLPANTLTDTESGKMRWLWTGPARPCRHLGQKPAGRRPLFFSVKLFQVYTYIHTLVFFPNKTYVLYLKAEQRPVQLFNS